MAAFLERQLQMERRADGSRHERRLNARDAAGTLLYIHGLGESALCFERLMADPRLAAWSHLAIDLEGYGKSSWANPPLSLDQHAERLAQLVDRRSLQVVVVGHSMGGVIGTLLCQRLGHRARALINIEGNVSPPDCGYSGRAVKFRIDQWLDHGFDQVLDQIYQDSESAEVRRAYGASIQMCDPRAFHLNSQELVDVSDAEIGARRLADLETEVVYVHGAPRGTGARSLELLGQAGIDTIRIDDAGHWPFLDQHDAFVEAIADYLDRLPTVR